MLPTKNALITGGTRGIGFHIAKTLEKQGSKITVTGRTARSDSELPETWNYLAIDFSKANETEEFAKRLRNMNFDILINNAGINKVSPILDVNMEDFDRIMHVNLRAPFLLTQAVLHGMMQKGWGRIINISSIFGHVSKEGRASYSTSKFGMEGFTKAVAAEVARSGVLINCVSPGFIDTELTRSVLGEDGMHAMTQQIPIRRMGSAQEIAEFVAWVASPLNTFISGQNLIIDGGYTSV